MIVASPTFFRSRKASSERRVMEIRRFRLSWGSGVARMDVGRDACGVSRGERA